MTDIIYHYDVCTGELTSEGQPDLNPLDNSEPLIPANATAISLPDAMDGKVAVFKDGAWSLVEDHRQQTIYDITDYTQSKVVTNLGAVPEGWTLQKPDDYCVWNTDSEAWEYSQELERPDKEASVRSKRNSIVDRVSHEINRLEDAGKDASAWRQYRVALRNVSEQEGFPFEVDWGEAPAEYTGK